MFAGLRERWQRPISRSATRPFASRPPSSTLVVSINRLLHQALIAAGCLWLLAGCDQLGIESTEVLAARREAESKAVGGACRHAGRAIEDCYALNKKADKAAVFAGWREMNDYMRENKIDAVSPQIAPP